MLRVKAQSAENGVRKVH